MLPNAIRQDFEYFDSTKNTQILSTLITHVNISNNVFSGFLQASISVFSLVSICLALFIIDKNVFLIVTISVSIFYAFIMTMVAQVLKETSNRIAISTNSEVQFITESLNGLRDIILKNTFKFFENELSLIDKNMRVARSNAVVISVFPKILLESFLLAIIGFIALFTINNNVNYILPVLGSFALGFSKNIACFSKSILNMASYQSSLASFLQLKS